VDQYQLPFDHVKSIQYPRRKFNLRKKGAPKKWAQSKAENKKTKCMGQTYKRLAAINHERRETLANTERKMVTVMGSSVINCLTSWQATCLL